MDYDYDYDYDPFDGWDDAAEWECAQVYQDMICGEHD